MFRILSGGAWLHAPHPAVAVPLALLLPGVRASVAQVAPFAAWWERHNDRALAGAGALWVVLGDSAAQGVGAPRPDAGWVCQLAARLREAGLPEMRIVNMSRSGARMRDVLEVQIPRLRALTAAISAAESNEAVRLSPALVTCAIGVNDLLRTRLPEARRDARELVASLPTGALLATLPRVLRQARAARLNAVLTAAAPAAGVALADLWGHTGPPYRGRFARDGFHPSERGYADWAAAFAEAILDR